MKIATIHQDTDCESPRESDCLGTLCLFHGRRNVPDEGGMGPEKTHAYVNGPEFKGVWLPVFMYDHSGVALSTDRSYPFNCPWDSDMLGVIYVDAVKMQDEGLHLNADCTRYFEREVETFGLWLNGECYGYVIKDENGEEVDSCWGFIGHDYAVEAAKEAGADEVSDRIEY